MEASQKLRAGRLLAKSQHGHPPDPRGLSVSSDEQELQESMAPPLPCLAPRDSNAKCLGPVLASPERFLLRQVQRRALLPLNRRRTQPAPLILTLTAPCTRSFHVPPDRARSSLLGLVLPLCKAQLLPGRLLSTSPGPADGQIRPSAPQPITSDGPRPRVSSPWPFPSVRWASLQIRPISCFFPAPANLVFVPENAVLQKSPYSCI